MDDEGNEILVPLVQLVADDNIESVRRHMEKLRKQRGETALIQEILSCEYGYGRNTRSALHCAAQAGRSEILKLLLISHVDPNSEDGSGNTPLHFAVDLGQPRAAHVLLEAKADPHAKNYFARTPADAAVAQSWDAPKIAFGKTLIGKMLAGDIPKLEDLPLDGASAEVTPPASAVAASGDGGSGNRAGAALWANPAATSTVSTLPQARPPPPLQQPAQTASQGGITQMQPVAALPKQGRMSMESMDGGLLAKAVPAQVYLRSPRDGPKFAPSPRSARAAAGDVAAAPEIVASPELAEYVIVGQPNDLVPDGAAPNVAEPSQSQDARGGSGCRIPNVEQRGITLMQLEAVLASVQTKFTQDAAWCGVSLYAVVDHVVIPATQTKRVSYVELVAAAPQPSKWFVSHYWGDVFAALVKCLGQHSKDRELSNESPYWICAFATVQGCLEEADWAVPGYNETYASNQWDNPASSPFTKALRVSDGTVSIIDGLAACFGRVWCCYEIWLAVTSASSSGPERRHLYDVYTTTGEKAVGVTDGFAKIDMRRAKAWWMNDKYSREKQFPAKLAQDALGLQLQKAHASHDSDRRHILNSIVGAPLDAEPPSNHENYDKLNNLVRGRFAAGAWRKALEAGQDMKDYQVALVNSGLFRLDLSFDDCNQFGDNWALLLSKALPRTLQNLSLDFNGCILLSDHGISSLVNAIPPNVKWLKIDVSGCKNITDATAQALASALRKLQLQHLELAFCNCSHITDSGFSAMAGAFPRMARTLSLNFWNCTFLTDSSVRAISDALPRDLRQLELRFGRCAQLRDNSICDLASKLPGMLEQFALDLRYNVLLTDVCAEALARHLPRGLKNLEVDFVQCAETTGRTKALLQEAASSRNIPQTKIWSKDDFRVNM